MNRILAPTRSGDRCASNQKAIARTARDLPAPGGNTLTVAGYLAADGIRGAVATTAEACYQALAPGERAAARQVLMRLGNRVDPIVLVDPGGGSIDQVACKPDRV